jgi:triacylglycerol esterase/lipase EstA (alpha/beta hydrolase family)
MKKTRRLLCLLLTVVLALSLCAIPVSAADDQARSDDPVVFVHGLMGWGERAGLNSVLPYWGMTTGSLTAYLNSLGYETYSATVGPISSAWDRACELYAQLTGTTVDYGAAHSAAHDHARRGCDGHAPHLRPSALKHKVPLPCFRRGRGIIVL